MPIEPRGYQLQAFSFAVRNRRAVLVSPTGSGKSLIAYLIARWYNKRTLIIVPTVSQQIAFLGMGFPDKASFCFYGYNGIEDKERVIDDIKKSAFGSGSKLRSSFRGKSFQTRNRLCTVDFSCVRHRPFKEFGIYRVTIHTTISCPRQ